MRLSKRLSGGDVDYPEEVLRLVREAVGDVKVYDGQPSEKLEERPERHVIVDVSVPVVSEQTVASTFDRETVSWQVRAIVRSGGQFNREDAAWAARALSKKIRDHLIRRRLRPGGELIRHELQDSMVDDQAMVSHATVIEVSQYQANV